MGWGEGAWRGLFKGEEQGKQTANKFEHALIAEEVG